MYSTKLPGKIDFHGWLSLGGGHYYRTVLGLEDFEGLRDMTFGAPLPEQRRAKGVPIVARKGMRPIAAAVIYANDETTA
jgi:hypothetical protein